MTNNKSLHSIHFRNRFSTFLSLPQWNKWLMMYITKLYWLDLRYKRHARLCHALLRILSDAREQKWSHVSVYTLSYGLSKLIGVTLNPLIRYTDPTAAFNGGLGVSLTKKKKRKEKSRFKWPAVQIFMSFVLFFTSSSQVTQYKLLFCPMMSFSSLLFFDFGQLGINKMWFANAL